MSTAIQVGGQLQPGTVDTPLDARSRIEKKEAVSSIPLPYIGQVFYAKDTQKLYVVKSLKSKQLNHIVVDKAEVNEYEEVGASAAAKPDHLVLIRPRAAKGIFPVVKAYADATSFESEGTAVCSKDSHNNVKFWNGLTLSAVGDSGIPAACEGLPVDIDISSLELESGYFVYSWIDVNDNESDQLILPFPAIMEPTPFTTNAVTSPLQPGLKIEVVTAQQYALTFNPDPLTLYFVMGQGLYFNGMKYFAEQTTDVLPETETETGTGEPEV